MKIRILGAAAGGGFPQWNCNCRNCRGIRDGTLRARARTQSSIAVNGADPNDWALVNASPDILAQLQANPVLQPARGARDTAIAAVLLVDGQVDHTTGLYMLRESVRPLPLWCTDQVYADLTQGNPVLRVLGHFCGVQRQALVADGREFAVDGVAGVRWRALAVAGRPAPYSPHRDAPQPGDNIALVIRDAASGASALYAPGLGAIEEPLWQVMQQADCVLVDGTFWSDDEMISLGLSKKRGSDIGHLAQSGAGGMLEWLERLQARTRRILVHVNNTNPILDEGSPQRAALDARGVEVAWDGMEIAL
ncbi:MAG: pyrroloquinoline quinone biosynthesis protein PqqB [Proteobacteria bacterium]|nr:pyrroloquinoline quinone biosynthesis protein PqqB [Pseudomonadota bacterium]